MEGFGFSFSVGDSGVGQQPMARQQGSSKGTPFEGIPNATPDYGSFSKAQGYRQNVWRSWVPVKDWIDVRV